MVTLMTIHTERDNVVFEETRTVVVKFAIDTILSPPYISDIWERPPAEVPPTFWARAQRVKTAIRGGGMGRAPASSKGIGRN